MQLSIQDRVELLEALMRLIVREDAEARRRWPESERLGSVSVRAGFGIGVAWAVLEVQKLIPPLEKRNGL